MKTHAKIRAEMRISMNKKSASVLVLLFLTILLCFFYTQKQTDLSKDTLTLTDYKLNTYVSITIYDPDKEYVLKACMDLCDRYERIFSRTDPDSELYRLNQGLLPSSEDGYYTISEDLFAAIQTGRQYAHLSDNAFSVGMEPLTSLWNFTDKTGTIPSASDIDNALPLTDSHDILLKEPDQIAFRPSSGAISDDASVNYGMGIDLGGIAKGYIADKLKDYLLSEGIHDALISLGGNVLCLGNRQGSHEKNAYTIGIQKPFDPNGDAFALLTVQNTVDAPALSVVTSGTYQRYFEKDGQLYHHILDSTTGYPVSNNLASVTIITPSSTDADALSTTCFTLGLQKGLKLLKDLGYADGFFITNDGNYYYTDGFLEKYNVHFP